MFLSDNCSSDLRLDILELVIDNDIKFFSFDHVKLMRSLKLFSLKSSELRLKTNSGFSP